MTPPPRCNICNAIHEVGTFHPTPTSIAFSFAGDPPPPKSPPPPTFEAAPFGRSIEVHPPFHDDFGMSSLSKILRNSLRRVYEETANERPLDFGPWGFAPPLTRWQLAHLRVRNVWWRITDAWLVLIGSAHIGDD